ncbi:Transcription initiation factor TFIID subunit 9 [Thecaphora frezii]
MPSLTPHLSTAPHPNPLPRLGFRGPIPRDARLMAVILASMRITDVQPDVLLQLLEFAHRYTYDVLSDALVYADHAALRQASSTVSLDDITLAIQSRVNYSFTKPPDKDTLLSLATSLNSVPLPPISDRHGIRLPPPQHCLTNVNFSLVPNPPPPDFDESHHDDLPSIAPVTTSATATAAGAITTESRGVGGGEEDDDYDDIQDIDVEPTRVEAVKGPEDGARSQPVASGVDGNAETSVVAAPAAAVPSRGVKRSLDEDEDYD